MDMTRFKPPCAEDEVVTLDHEEEMYYCQHCDQYKYTEDMQDIEYEMCSECFELAADHWRKWPETLKAMTENTQNILDTLPKEGVNLNTLCAIEKMVTYLQGL